jgi:hypothetical protein
MGAGGCVEVVEVDVELAGGSDVVVPDALCEEPAFPLIRTAVAIPAPARTRTVAATTSRRSGVSVTVQRRGESAKSLSGLRRAIGR